MKKADYMCSYSETKYFLFILCFSNEESIVTKISSKKKKKKILFNLKNIDIFAHVRCTRLAMWKTLFFNHFTKITWRILNNIYLEVWLGFFLNSFY